MSMVADSSLQVRFFNIDGATGIRIACRAYSRSSYDALASLARAAYT
jgi:hypothetical protein